MRYGMDCSRFEVELVELLETGGGGRERDARIRQLRAHAGSCESCRGSIDLLDWSTLPAGERDGFEVPDDAYWASFDARLRQRLDRGRRWRPWRTWAIAAAAAIVGLALLAVGSLMPEGEIRNASADQAPPPDAIDDPTLTSVGDEFEGLIGTLDEWYGFDGDDSDPAGPGPGGGEWLFPSTADLDADARRNLIDWLREESTRLGGGSA